MFVAFRSSVSCARVPSVLRFLRSLRRFVVHMCLRTVRHRFHPSVWSGRSHRRFPVRSVRVFRSYRCLIIDAGGRAARTPSANAINRLFRERALAAVGRICVTRQRMNRLIDPRIYRSIHRSRRSFVLLYRTDLHVRPTRAAARRPPIRVSVASLAPAQ